MNSLISVIVPIYNTSNYLRRCIDSIINQSYNNLEIILINDGSSDNSLSIISEYNDKRIVVINKKNTGVSDTRNIGINKSNGKYIMFVDSDDEIDKDYIKEMYERIIKNKSNVVLSGMVIKGSYDKYVNLNKELNNIDFYEIIDLFINTNLFSSACKMLIKKSVIKDTLFNTKLRFAEDMLFSYNILKNNNISYLNNCGYKYYQYDTSVVHNNDISNLEKHLNDIIYVLNEILKDNKDKYIIINNRKLSKINLLLKKLIYNKIKYKDYKNYVIKFLKYCDINNIKLNEINYESILNKLRLRLLINKHYYLYYLINTLVKLIKRK